MESMIERRIGRNVLVLSATAHYWLGRVEAIDETHIHLSSAAWIANIGRYHSVLASGQPDASTEVEPHPEGVITSVPLQGSAIIDWPHELWTKAI